jgi:methionyl aminopeptidase
MFPVNTFAQAANEANLRVAGQPKITEKEGAPEGQLAFDAVFEVYPEVRVGDISAAVQRVTEGAGFSVVRSLVGHGVGRSMHEEPQIPNFGEPGRGPRLAPGMTLAIEPMITAGGATVFMAEDRWSISTDDGSLAAHFEHTVAVTEDDPRILTRTQSLVR